LVWQEERICRDLPIRCRHCVNIEFAQGGNLDAQYNSRRGMRWTWGVPSSGGASCSGTGAMRKRGAAVQVFALTLTLPGFSSEFASTSLLPELMHPLPTPYFEVFWFLRRATGK
jgi:hypothetical protein